MKGILIFLFLLSYKFVFCQKLPLDTAQFTHFASVGNGLISNNGQYISYVINNIPFGSRRLIVQSALSTWKREFTGDYNITFSDDNKFGILKINDSLTLVELGTNNIQYVQGVTNFTCVTDNHKDWLVYNLLGKDNETFFYNLDSSQKLNYSSVLQYSFLDSGRHLILLTKVHEDTSYILTLNNVDLKTSMIRTIWSARSPSPTIGALITGNTQKELAFNLNERSSSGESNSIWVYGLGADSAFKIVNNNIIGIDSDYEIADLPPSFSMADHRVYFRIKLKYKPKPRVNAVNVDVWSYTDSILQPLQLEHVKEENLYTCVVDLGTRKIIRLEGPNESIVGYSPDHVLLKYDLGYEGIYEAYWNKSAQSTFWLVSCIDGSRKIIRNHIINPFENPGLSPGGRWIIYYSVKDRNYMSYEIATGIIRNITSGINTSWKDQENDRPDYKTTWVPWRKTWLFRETKVLIYDNFDIWEVDPSCKQNSINITNGFGRADHIKFEVANEDQLPQKNANGEGRDILLTSYNKVTKDRGFYHTFLEKSANPILCTAGPYVYGYWSGNGTFNYPPEKARDSNIYFIIRMSAVEAPNYFVLKNFSSFVQITNVQPQREFNWLKTELVHWIGLKGQQYCGILYKPENFDSTRKYPVIFDYYEIRSDELNIYIWPDYSENRINIPWYVSNGYIVFVPDFHYNLGETGESALNSIVSAAIFLGTNKWVDKNKMGLQGHSFGGFETNYIITHSHLFAAACSASGMCDLISWYGSTLRGSYPKYWTEYDQGRLGIPPWISPQVFIDNSPIYRADKITTPLLLMANKGDGVVPYTQGIELFTALRRLSKVAWLLQYDDGDHSLNRGKDAVDYSIRMYQFFNHFLKGKPAPSWMIDGIPARLKGISSGLDLQ